MDLFAKHVDYDDSGLVDSIIPSMVTEEENNFLTTIHSPEEILKAIKVMDLDSAPSPDGFNGYFFASCWDIIGIDVVNAVQYFFVNGQLLASFNYGLIILIPKVEHADLIKQFRPIALTNFMFKIIPKILAFRLSSVAARLISPQQHAFVPGRNISDFILTTSECFNLLDSKGFGGNVAVKVGITKACFDTLSWDFLLHVLQAFGYFSQQNFLFSLMEGRRVIPEELTPLSSSEAPHHIPPPYVARFATRTNPQPISSGEKTNAGEDQHNVEEYADAAAFNPFDSDTDQNDVTSKRKD
ncbi:hypothetical protein ACLB2K_007571 [Fragaria x ananassa]